LEESIHIFITSDIHGNVLPLTYGNNKKAELGLVKAATLIKEELAKYDNCLLIDNGISYKAHLLLIITLERLQNLLIPCPFY
jgi:2',3'-cyclic-nucleotide 2'-phosphodiesterase (5'-nucleotidase family)